MKRSTMIYLFMLLFVSISYREAQGAAARASGAVAHMKKQQHLTDDQWIRFWKDSHIVGFNPYPAENKKYHWHYHHSSKKFSAYAICATGIAKALIVPLNDLLHEKCITEDPDTDLPDLIAKLKKSIPAEKSKKYCTDVASLIAIVVNIRNGIIVCEKIDLTGDYTREQFIKDDIKTYTYLSQALVCTAKRIFIAPSATPNAHVAAAEKQDKNKEAMFHFVLMLKGPA